jgi:hypothetical protein
MIYNHGLQLSKGLLIFSLFLTSCQNSSASTVSDSMPAFPAPPSSDGMSAVPQYPAYPYTAATMSFQGKQAPQPPTEIPPGYMPIPQGPTNTATPTFSRINITPLPTWTPITGGGKTITQKDFSQTLTLKPGESFTIQRTNNATRKIENPYMVKQISGPENLADGDQVYQVTATGTTHITFNVVIPCPTVSTGESMVCSGPPPFDTYLTLVIPGPVLPTSTVVAYPADGSPPAWENIPVNSVLIERVGKASREEIAASLLDRWFAPYTEFYADQGWRILENGKIVSLKLIPKQPDDATKIEEYNVDIDYMVKPATGLSSSWNSGDAQVHEDGWVEHHVVGDFYRDWTFFVLNIQGIG